MRDMIYGLWYMEELFWKLALFFLRVRNRVALPTCHFAAFLHCRISEVKRYLMIMAVFRLGGGVSTSLQEVLCGYTYGGLQNNSCYCRLKAPK